MSIITNVRKTLGERIAAALNDFTNARASMHIPPDEDDVDIVLADCRDHIATLESRLAQIEEWSRRSKGMGCPCDAADGHQCKYSDPANAKNYPCSCVCHSVEAGGFPVKED